MAASTSASNTVNPLEEETSIQRELSRMMTDYLIKSNREFLGKQKTTNTVFLSKINSPQEELSLPILIADRIIKSAQEAAFKHESNGLAKLVDRLSQMLRSAVDLAVSKPSLYDRPLRRISSDITKNLHRALTLIRKCNPSGVRRVFSIITIAEFRKVSNLLESSIDDMKWLLSIFESDGGTCLSLPPIASNDPMLAWAWSFICTVQMGQQIEDRVDAANELASLASDNDRNKKMIVKEGGVLALLKLLKEGASPEAQIAAANALVNIATDDQETVTLIVDALVGVLRDSPVKVQIAVADLVARMAELDPFAQVEFMRENVTRPLLSLLSMDVIMEVAAASDPAGGKTSLQSIVEMMETPEVKLKLKVSCAGALWKLSKGGLTTCRKITETKWLLCLAKIIEKEKEELRYNCLMTIAEITAVAESNADLRRAAFKTNSPAAKAVLGQLLRVIQEENDPSWQIPAIRAIGCLARTFRTREARIMGPLVAELGNRDAEVATEAAIALGKFACPENFNCSEHSKAIIEFDGVPLMRLLRSGDQAQRHGLVLLCYLALNAGNSRALEEARASNNFDGIVYSVIVQYPQLTGLIAKALYGFR